MPSRLRVYGDDCAEGGAGWPGEEERFFFFEKKKQKTIVPGRAPPGSHRVRHQKDKSLFASFSSEKEDPSFSLRDYRHNAT
jgi:hypothetical protein